LWNEVLGILAATPADHPPWLLHAASVQRLEEDLVVAAGLPEPTGPPVVHFSPGVDVRIGTPRRVRR
jgi:uncharacterized protein YqjF (DUF2071 family)